MESLTLEAAREALQLLSPADRHTRVRIGEALRDHFGNDAFDIWDAWYSGHDRYTAAEARQAWRSFGKGGGKPCTIGTLIYEAQKYGFKIGRKHQEKLSSEEAARREAERQARREADAVEAARIAADAAAKAADIWSSATPAPADHPYLLRKRIQPHNARWVSEWVKEWTDPDSGEVKTFRHANALVIPIWSGPGKLASLQAILPAKTIGRKPRDGAKDERRDKDYLAGGQKLGCYCTISSIKADTPIVLLCEGFATGASLHEATGHPVVVCFDAGNLIEVAKALRAKLPAARLVLCADNDQYHPPEKGNPGIKAATEAAEAVNGDVAVPQFETLDGDPTDFNDLAREQGQGAVREAIELALNPPAAAPAPATEQSLPWAGESELPSAASAQASPPSPPADEDDDEPGRPDKNNHFAILGYNHGEYFVFVHAKRQMMVVHAGAMGINKLLELAPLNWWEMHFPSGSEKSKFDLSSAADFVINTAHRRGIYDPSRVRGRGAWKDEGRIVFHHGGYLSVDGKSTDITDIKSRYVYELAQSLPAPGDVALTSDEGEYLLSLSERFRWERPGSAPLLLGWVALAPVCGALTWRPHLWCSGGAGSGKSTVLTMFVHHLLGGLDVYALGNSTEPGLRQELSSDARPVALDESESNEESDIRRIQNILGMIRQASTETGAKTFKGTASGKAMSFDIRSMFCLASIQVALKQKADIDRLTVLGLRSTTEAEKSTAGEGWRLLRDELYKMHRDETLPARLLRRAIDMLPITLKNVRVFTDAAADRFGSQRDGDQYGTLLAGTWSLISTGLASREDALELIDRYDWSEHREMADTDESQKALSALLGAHIRMPAGQGELTVYELLAAACGYRLDGVVDLKPENANALLSRHGMRVKEHAERTGENFLMLSNNSQELRRLMHGSGFEADLRGVLLRVPGADRNGNKAVKFNGVTDKVIAIPVAPIVAGLSEQRLVSDERPF